MKFLLSLAILIASAEAATKVAVLEVGVGGAVRRTTAKSTRSSTDAVASFWRAMHAPGRKLQHAGMPVVPDLFNKADSGVVIGLAGNGIDLEEMPNIAGFFEEDGNNGVVGHMDLEGSHSHALMSNVPQWEEVTSVAEAAKREAEKPGLSGIHMNVDTSSVSTIDSEMLGIISDLEKQAKDSGKTVVIYLVLEEDAAVSRRRNLESRRRLDEADEGENNENNNGGDAEDDDGNGNNNGNQYGGYYGYGYYNAYGEWVTPYKTMFQIQYFNVVLWTSIGLTIVLFFTVYLMLYMPLEADTLLFGESAKMVGDD